MRNLKTRLSELERKNSGSVVCCFINPGETSEQAVQRAWPGGLPKSARVLLFTWQEAGQ